MEIDNNIIDFVDYRARRLAELEFNLKVIELAWLREFECNDFVSKEIEKKIYELILKEKSETLAILNNKLYLGSEDFLLTFYNLFKNKKYKVPRKIQAENNYIAKELCKRRDYVMEKGIFMPGRIVSSGFNSDYQLISYGKGALMYEKEPFELFVNSIEPRTISVDPEEGFLYMKGDNVDGIMLSRRL